MADNNLNIQAETPAPAKGTGNFIWGVGRRKSATARVRIRPGEGKILINKREVDEYFVTDSHRNAVRSPLTVTEAMGRFDVFVNVDGGGDSGQSGAVLLGIARALIKIAPDLEPTLRDHGLLTRDSRMKERKKYGKRGARRSFQFSKR